MIPNLIGIVNIDINVRFGKKQKSRYLVILRNNPLHPNLKYIAIFLFFSSKEWTKNTIRIS